MRKYNLFNFLEKKVSNAEIDAVCSKVMNEVAFREMALHIAISYIANTLSKCEYKTYEKGEEVKGKLYYLLNVSPNPNESSSQFINHIVSNYYRNDKALVVPHNDYLYCADDFDLDDTNPLKEFVYKSICFSTTALKKSYKASEVFHFKLDNQDTKKLIDLLYSKYGELMGLAIESYKRTNGKKYKLILERAEAGDTAFNKVFNEVIRGQLKTFIENDNAVYPQYRGTDLQEFSTATPSNSSDIIALRKEVFETTAQAFKVPLPMLYGNMTNLKEITAQFLTFCIDPLADMMSEEFTRKYYTFNEWQNGYKVVIDTTCISHIDILDIGNAVDKLVSSGFANIDELRKTVGWDELNTEYSQRHYITKNYEPAENALARADGKEE